MTVRQDQLDMADAEGFCDGIQGLNRRVAFTRLDAADVLLGEICALSHLLLRQAGRLAQARKIPPDQFAHVHAPTNRRFWSLRLSTIICIHGFTDRSEHLGVGMPIMKKILRGFAVACLLAWAGPSMATDEEFDAVQNKLSPTNTMTCHLRWSDMAIKPLEVGEEVMPFTLSYVDGVLWFRGIKVPAVEKPDPAQRFIAVSINHLLELYGGLDLVEKVKSHDGNPYGQKIGLAFKDAKLMLAPVRKTALDGQPKVVDCERLAAPAPNPDQFNQALEAMGQLGPPLMTYTCRLSGNQVLGLPVPTGREQFKTVSISIGEAGVASVNGTALQPVHLQQAEGSDETVGAIYNALEFERAMVSDVSPGLYGITQEEQQAFDKLKSMMGGITAQVMGDRRRFVSIMLDQDAIGFFDLDAYDQPANRTMGNCARGR